MKKINLNDVKHPIYAFIIVALVAIVLHGSAEWKSLPSALVGVGAAEVALFGKELWDKCVKRKFFDWEDILLGQIGITAGFLCAWLLM